MVDELMVKKSGGSIKKVSDKKDQVLHNLNTSFIDQQNDHILTQICRICWLSFSTFDIINLHIRALSWALVDFLYLIFIFLTVEMMAHWIALLKSQNM